MQTRDTCEAQEARCRRELKALGLDDKTFTVISDEAVSGQKESRQGYSHIMRLLRREALEILIVADQSRFSRGANAAGVVFDLYYYGGRFIAAQEGIDTNRPGWETHVAFGGAQHSTHNFTKARQVRQSLEHCSTDGNRSLGDFLFGYRSVPREGHFNKFGRIKKDVVVCPEEAEVVRWVFNKYVVEHWPVSAIVKDLNRRKIPRGPKCRKDRWEPQNIYMLLHQPKYIGRWDWGKTETRHASDGRTKASPTKQGRVIKRELPSLRIVDEDIWRRAQGLLNENNKRYWSRKRTGHTRHDSPVHNLGGLCRCPSCGRTLRSIKGSDGRYYLACAMHYDADCPFARHVAARDVENALYGFLENLLNDWPDWLAGIEQRVTCIVNDLTSTADVNLKNAEAKLLKVRTKISRLIKYVEEHDATDRAFDDRLKECRHEEQAIEQEIAYHKAACHGELVVPDRNQVRAEIRKLAGALCTPSYATAAALKGIIAQAILVETPRPGRSRPIIQLRLTLRSSALLGLICRQTALAEIESRISESPESSCQPTEITLDVTPASKVERCGPRLQQLTEEGNRRK